MGTLSNIETILRKLNDAQLCEVVGEVLEEQKAEGDTLQLFQRLWNCEYGEAVLDYFNQLTYGEEDPLEGESLAELFPSLNELCGKDFRQLELTDAEGEEYANASSKRFKELEKAARIKKNVRAAVLEASGMQVALAWYLVSSFGAAFRADPSVLIPIHGQLVELACENFELDLAGSSVA